MVGQAGFFDGEERLRALSAAGDPLERLMAVIDFDAALTGVGPSLSATSSPLVSWRIIFDRIDIEIADVCARVGEIAGPHSTDGQINDGIRIRP